MTTQLNNDIVAWQEIAAHLERVKAREMALRKKVFDAAFPNAVVGTNTLDLGRGYELKAVRKLNYNLAETRDGNETSGALDAIEALGNEGGFIAERLVKWKPELSVTEYKALSMEDPTHRKIKELIDKVLTITEGAPTLDVKVPKSA